MERLGTPHIVTVLTAISWRSALIRMLPVLAIVGALGCVAAIIALVSLGPAGRGLMQPIMVITFLALAATIALCLLQRRNLVQTARRADFDFKLAETLSTAIDVAPTGSADSAVARSLRSQAEDIAAGLRLSQAIPLVSRLLLVTSAVLVFAACGAAAAYMFVGPTDVQPAAPALADAASEPADYAADDIEVLAQLLADDAERRNSDYLKAVATSLKELAQVERAGAPQTEIRAQLEALINHAAAGYDGRLPNWLANEPGNPGAVLQSARAFSDARQQAALERANAPSEGPRVKSSDMYDLPEDRLTQSAAPNPPSGGKPLDNASSQREGSLENASLEGGEFSAVPMEDEAFESAGSLPVGAAAQSGKGESNVAGGGSQALAESKGFLETMADPTQSMSISADDTQEGSSIRMHVPTSASLSPSSALAGDSGGDWARQNAQIVSRQAIRPDANAVVARYFNRPAKPSDAL